MNTQRLYLEIFLLQHNIHYWRLHKSHNGSKLILNLRWDQLQELIENPVVYEETTRVTIHRSGLVTYKVVDDGLRKYAGALSFNSSWQAVRDWL
jgi:hypothetical protein